MTPKSKEAQLREETVDLFPDVTTQAHPEPNLSDNSSQVGEEKLQNVLPQITELAKKVGGFKKLAEIAENLDEMGK